MIKKILIKIFYILFIPILIWNVTILIQTIQNPNETPSVFGIKIFCIISGSMEPNINVNDVVIIKEVSQNEINTGDIISFIVNGETITHRIMNIERNSNGDLIYTTQGDNNNIEDKEKITFENIEGKYIGKIPKIGKIIIALKSKITLGVVIAILIFFYLIEQNINNKKIRRSEERKKYEQKKTLCQ